MKCGSKPLTQTRARESELERHEEKVCNARGKRPKEQLLHVFEPLIFITGCQTESSSVLHHSRRRTRITTAFLTLFLFMFAQNKYGVKKRPPPPANCLPLGGSCKSPGTECCDFCAFCQCRLFRTVCYCRMGNPRCWAGGCKSSGGRNRQVSAMWSHDLCPRSPKSTV